MPELVRPPIDDFERLIIKNLTEIGQVSAVWIREIPEIGGGKKYMRVVWVMLTRHSRTGLSKVQQLVNEFHVRYLQAPWALEFRVLIDDVPPKDVGAACVFWRGEAVN